MSLGLGIQFPDWLARNRASSDEGSSLASISLTTHTVTSILTPSSG